MVTVPEIKYEIEIPEGVSITQDIHTLSVSGSNGTLKRDFKHRTISINVANKKVILQCSLPKKRESALIGTWRSHINNMIYGSMQDFVYEMKVVYAHFPMKVSVKGNEVIIENFLGNRTPRIAKILPGMKVSVEKETLKVSGPNKSDVGQTCANIEKATIIKNYDIRVFQDGIYLIKKGEKNV